MLLSSEILLLFLVPALVVVLAWRQRDQLLGRHVLGALALIVVVQFDYLVYFAGGFIESLCAADIYFSANDVLHVGTIAWLVVAGLTPGAYRRSGSRTAA